MKTPNITLGILSLILGLCICKGAWAGTDVLFDRVQTAVKENLVSTVSDKVELEELRTVLSLILGLCICKGAWAGTDVLFDRVQTAVKENLVSTVSDKVELEELRIV